jgi:hypothetical protein
VGVCLCVYAQNFDLFVCACVPAVGLVWVVGLAVAAKTITQNWKVLVGVSEATLKTNPKLIKTP